MMRDRSDLDTTTESPPSLTGRRAALAGLVAASTIALVAFAAYALNADGLDPVDAIMLGLFAIALPWSIVGFWNAVIGLVVMRAARDPVGAVCPPAARVRGDESIRTSTAILLCIRNEAPDRVMRNLQALLHDLNASGAGAQVHVYVLSDTSDVAIAEREDDALAELAAAWRGRVALTYRRRTDNAGFKAGNIRDFCERWGDRHDFAITLDADSVMSAQAMLTLIRVMQADRKLGILQGLVIGMPSASAFARIFQFGMRLGMRSYTIGSAWWQGDCGPYWGHNAILRLQPFIAHCRLPMLRGRGPLSGAILSHDQIEAVLMRRAGYDVRVLPREDLGFEENPPTLLEFLRRDQRWCHGNMQYLHLLALPGLKLTSRAQLGLAVLMFISSAAWVSLLLLLTAVTVVSDNSPLRAGAGAMLFAILVAMTLAPKTATIIDVMLRPDLRKSYGGGWRMMCGVACETAFFILLSPIMALGHTLYLAGLMLGRSIGWTGQTRDQHGVPWSQAARALWPATALGALATCAILIRAPAALPFALYFASGLLLAIPFAVLTASPRAGYLMARARIALLPEETSPPPTPFGGLGPAGRPARPTTRGVSRSLHIYYGDRDRATAMDRLHARFVHAGDLAFDIGAHVGDRVASLRRLGCRVVAVEPQPALVRALRLLYRRDSMVAIEAAAVGDTTGVIDLHINVENPTVSTVSPAFIAAAARAPGWSAETWNERACVPLTTLDNMIARHGVPTFVKIDVEGHEAQVLHGLSVPIPALSFEFTTIQRAVALDALARCGALGFDRFNAALGESQSFAHADWIGLDAMRAWLLALPDDANSGDIYAARARS